MFVKAAPGIKVPRENDPRQYITEAEPVELEMTGYYIRRMSDGDLLEASTEEVQAAREAAAQRAGAEAEAVEAAAAAAKVKAEDPAVDVAAVATKDRTPRAR